MVKAAKKATYAVLRDRDVTDEELIAVFAGVESLLNSVITAIHIRFITPVEIESLQMERNVFEYPLARNKSELALSYYCYSGRASA